jgi:hypothetical protein
VKEGTFEAPLEEYSWETTATPVSTQAGVYDVTVKVMWEKQDQEFKIRTYLYRRPMIMTGGRGGNRR